jgi:adenosylcobyric acid synthase
MPHRARSLMVLGTASHVGKSTVAAAFCRLLAEEGWRVAPFKAQNMALNSFVTRDGAEIGRAQVAQAEAAGVEPLAEMNPILLKPMGGASQVIVDGSPIGVMTAREYYAAKDRLWPRIAAAYERLASRFEVIVLEGAGSPVEVNLMEQDLTNLRMAHHADAAIVLVADIERGGVFAQIVGTWELLGRGDRERVIGFIINKFRGDPTILEPGLAFLQERTGRPVLGVLPYRPDLVLDQEDSLGIDATATPDDGTTAEIDVVVIRLPALSNFNDFEPLGQFPGVRVRYVDRAELIGRPDLLILPGSKTTVRDLQWLRVNRIDARIIERVQDEAGPIVLGICGGFQMLGTRIDDPEGVESACQRVGGLGLLDVSTRFEATKARHRVAGRTRDGGYPIVGYEIHMGQTRRGPEVEPWADIIRQRDGTEVEDGAVSPSGRIIGTYLHGLFDSGPFTAALVDRLRAQRGLAPLDPERWRVHAGARSGRHAALADWLRNHLDLGPIHEAIGRRV